VTQERPFDVILINPTQENPDPDDEDLNRFFSDGGNDRGDYR
jgi:hypothetical protein